MRLIALLSVLLVAAPSCSKADPDRHLATEPKTAHLVPPFHERGWELVGNSTLPCIRAEGENMITAAMAQILRYEADVGLQNEEDRAVMRLLRQYGYEGRSLGVRVDRVADAYGHPARMAYSCKQDIYVIAPHVCSSVPMLALELYHEARHAAQCEALLGARSLDRGQVIRPAGADLCAAEAAAFAAQSRLLQAMIDRQEMPRLFSPLDPDAKLSLETLYSAWHALSRNAFCGWYHAASQAPTPPR